MYIYIEREHMYKTYTYGTHVYIERKYITYIYNLYININNFSIDYIYIYMYEPHIYNTYL